MWLPQYVCLGCTFFGELVPNALKLKKNKTMVVKVMNFGFFSLCF